ncbi:MAG: hypothetical protein KKA19_03430 [Candidatus Margulisbacteria bacterium]|nr:hypothetical protein [Candidatus Margulisiibacteriota bacterium]
MEDKLDSLEEYLKDLLPAILDEVQTISKKLDKIELRQQINTLTIKEHDERLRDLEVKVG